MMLDSILYPVLTLIFLTILVGLRTGMLRLKAVKNKDLNPEYFKLNKGYDLPEYLQKSNRNFLNLLELPILFYIISIILYLKGDITKLDVITSWLFVLSRYIHSYIHLFYNYVPHRALMYLLGVFVLVILFFLLMLKFIS